MLTSEARTRSQICTLAHDRQQQQAVCLDRAADTVEELLNLFDDLYGICAYGTILNCEPDPIGFENYDGLVRNGMHNGHIVAEVALSAEGPQPVCCPARAQ